MSKEQSQHDHAEQAFALAAAMSQKMVEVAALSRQRPHARDEYAALQHQLVQSLRHLLGDFDWSPDECAAALRAAKRPKPESAA